MIDLVIFDADGVLFDSYESNIAYYNAIFAEVGELPLSAEEEIDSISMATSLIFGRRARGNKMLIERMSQVSVELDFAPFFELLKPPLELRLFMIELKKRYKIGLATNRSATVPALVEHLKLSEVFDGIACARDENVRPKPAPDILELCMRRANTIADRSVYVGDSRIDREAAEAAGTHFVGVGKRLDAPRRIGNLSELPARLEDWFRAPTTTIRV